MNQPRPPTHYEVGYSQSSDRTTAINYSDYPGLVLRLLNPEMPKLTKHTKIAINERLSQRKLGLPSKIHGDIFFERFINNSTWIMNRLEVSKIFEHKDWINDPFFSNAGHLVCCITTNEADRGRSCAIWDWQASKFIRKISTKHTSYVSCSRFCNWSDANIITASGDGTLRILDLKTSLSEVVMSQPEQLNGFEFIAPQTLLTFDPAGSVKLIDFRVRKPSELLFLARDKIPIYSIGSHPIDRHKIAIASRATNVSFFDLRYVATSGELTYRLDSPEGSHAQSVAFNSKGDKLLVSFQNSVVVYRTDNYEILQHLKANETNIIGSCWFGDDFVISHDWNVIFGWSLKCSDWLFRLGNSQIDPGGCNVNVHPSMPILASTNGYYDFKIWEPTYIEEVL